jgi:hypothetical protein
MKQGVVVVVDALVRDVDGNARLELADPQADIPTAMTTAPTTRPILTSTSPSRPVHQVS